MEAEKKTLSELRSQQKLMQDKILDLRKKMGGVNAARENQRMVNKQVKILENRLDKALVRFNEALSENKRLRQEIDNLRRERVVFDNIYRKLERELHEKKRQMANTIEMSNQAYEARDQAQIEVAAIEQTNAKEQSDFEAQMSQLEESIKEEKERRAALLEGEEDESLTRGDLTPEEEDKLKQNVTQTAWSMARDKASIQVSMEKVQSYEEAWTKIKAATGIQDINELVRIFIANEDQNFSLFNYVREQNSEVEKLEEQIAELREEEARHAQEGGGDASQHKQLLQDLESKLEATNAAAQKFESKFQDAQKTVSRQPPPAAAHTASAHSPLSLAAADQRAQAGHPEPVQQGGGGHDRHVGAAGRGGGHRQQPHAVHGPGGAAHQRDPAGLGAAAAEGPGDGAAGGGREGG